jgi:hypothetical protein
MTYAGYDKTGEAYLERGTAESRQYAIRCAIMIDSGLAQSNGLCVSKGGEANCTCTSASIRFVGMRGHFLSL